MAVGRVWRRRRQSPTSRRSAICSFPSPPPLSHAGRVESFTFMAGSSLGGLISAYAGYHYAATFRRVACVSPSLWWDNRHMIAGCRRHGTPDVARWYQDMGTSEGSGSIDDLRAMRDVLLSQGFVSGVDLMSLEAQGAGHNNPRGPRAFPGCCASSSGSPARPAFPDRGAGSRSRASARDGSAARAAEALAEVAEERRGISTMCSVPSGSGPHLRGTDAGVEPHRRMQQFDRALVPSVARFVFRAIRASFAVEPARHRHVAVHARAPRPVGVLPLRLGDVSRCRRRAGTRGGTARGATPGPARRTGS